MVSSPSSCHMLCAEPMAREAVEFVIGRIDRTYSGQARTARTVAPHLAAGRAQPALTGARSKRTLPEHSRGKVRSVHDKRKLEHLQICLDRDVRSTTTTGLERYRLLHEALPEMALDQVNPRTCFLGHKLHAPLLISSMTGGTPLAREVNRRLATAAQELGLAMGLGSQRAGLEDPALMSSYQVRDLAPDVLLFANLGAVQLNAGYGLEECKRAVESVGADGLILHLNGLQEALQTGGDTDFRGLQERIAEICRCVEFPVLVKEVGWGMSGATARALCDAGVAALDVAGAGGTSWSKVERHRSTSPADAAVARAFCGWGVPTADALQDVRRACPDVPLVASGGIADGVQVALCLALGADLVGLAQALLRPAIESTEALMETLDIILRQLRIAMFACGAPTIKALDGSRVAPRS